MNRTADARPRRTAISPWPVCLAIAGLLLLAVACRPDDAVLPATGNPLPPPALPPPETVANPGVFPGRVIFGQSAAASGPTQALGTEMRLGIMAAFAQANRNGGIHGRMLELTTHDDGYEPDRAYDNTRHFVDEQSVFALIGEVGTPTARAAVPVAQAGGVPFVAPFTGAEFLRDPSLDNVLNMRASYYQETEEIVARLTQDLGITRIAVIYQNDSYGGAGLRGAEAALARRGLAPVSTWYYQRNTDAVKTALLHLIIANPEAVIMIGAYAPVAEIISQARRYIDPVFMSVSFVGSNALAAELGQDGAGVYVTQVVPFPYPVPAPENPDLPVVASYRQALADHAPAAVPGFVSLEGYLAGRLAIAGLDACGPQLTRPCFLNALRSADQLDLGGFPLAYGPGDNQGSDAVYLTVIGPDGQYRPVHRLGAAP